MTNGNRRRGWAGRLAGAALALAATLGGARADAAIVNVTKTETTRDEASDKLRTQNVRYNVSYQDCVDDVEFTFAVSVAGPTSGFQVWASESVDCKQSINRQGSGGTTAGCALLAQSFPVSTGKVAVTAKQLAGALSGVDRDKCTDDSGTSTAPRLLKIYFMIIGSDDPVPDGNVYVWEETQIDLLGPAPPSADEMRLDPGDGLLILNLPVNADSDKLGYYIYCDPNPNPPKDAVEDVCTAGTGGTGGTGAGGGGAGGAGGKSTGGGGAGGGKGSAGGGTGGGGGGGGKGGAASSSSSSSSSGTTDAGSDASDASTDGSSEGGVDGGGTTACGAGTKLGCVDTDHPSSKSKSVCNSRIPASATQPVISGLENDTPYVVAIAAYDTVNNIGPLSVLQCGTPKPTVTFFNQYCADGGVACDGGCGTCTVGQERDLTWPGLAATALAAVGLAVRRDERRRQMARARAARETE